MGGGPADMRFRGNRISRPSPQLHILDDGEHLLDRRCRLFCSQLQLYSYMLDRAHGSRKACHFRSVPAVRWGDTDETYTRFIGCREFLECSRRDRIVFYRNLNSLSGAIVGDLDVRNPFLKVQFIAGPWSNTEQR